MSQQSGSGAQTQANAAAAAAVSTSAPAAAVGGVQPQVIQLQPTQMVSAVAAPPQPGSIQIVQQIVGPGGEVQQIPIQLTSQQLQMIRAQMTGKVNVPCATGISIVIRTMLD